MEINKFLNGLLKKIPTALGCTLMGADGIPIAQVFPFPQKENSLTVEISFFIKQLKEILKSSTDSLKELTIKTQKYIFLYRFINQEYYLILTLNSEQHLGKSKYLLKILAPQIEI